ncbi:hypothetical protein [Domibacillus mangrovi]|uniref:Uncharacterized protein n=1 Tax=Domibacillus mangrovi TaxID=1714354 RepID=A0A1Q5NZE1_9BACI|nr:hypothetical protein [Domibacillus mangrovi]OKL35375.1 hypothetical protein BLL40_15800 [Domibacillus mangrovi]
MATIHELIEQAEVESRDEKARRYGLIVAVSGEVYTLSVSKHSVVYVEYVAGKWDAWRETHSPNKKEPISYKEIARAQDIEFVFAKVCNYFDFLEKRRRGRK